MLVYTLIIRIVSYVFRERETFLFWKYERIAKVRGEDASETLLLCWKAVYTKGSANVHINF